MVRGGRRGDDGPVDFVLDLAVVPRLAATPELRDELLSLSAVVIDEHHILATKPLIEGRQVEAFSDGAATDEGYVRDSINS